MPDQNLTEISHLFLSSIRERGGATRPVRKPPPASQPPRGDVTVDVTPEEFFEEAASVDKPVDESNASATPAISAVIASHFGHEESQRVREYASHLARSGGRVGMIELSASEFRITCFDGSPGDCEIESALPIDGFNPREAAQSLEEMSWDLQRWLLVIPNPRLEEARNILKHVDRWTLLSTCDHEGVVAGYRVLKGLADVHRPQIALALLDVPDEVQAERVVEKISSVCRQFLNWPIEAEPAVQRVENVAEHVAMHCRLAPADAGAHWQLMTDFLVRANNLRTTPKPIEEIPEPTPSAPAESEMPMSMPQSQLTEPTSDITDVIDVAADASESDILAAILRHTGNELIECPVAPPMCPSAKLSVSRDRRLVLVAIARQGLSDLRDIGHAYRWLMDNRALVCMAMPQFSVDPHPMPQLRLLVNQSDASAEAIQPLLQSSHISIRAYRKLRWGEKTGLLLEAA